MPTDCPVVRRIAKLRIPLELNDLADMNAGALVVLGQALLALRRAGVTRHEIRRWNDHACRNHYPELIDTVLKSFVIAKEQRDELARHAAGLGPVE